MEEQCHARRLLRISAAGEGRREDEEGFGEAGREACGGGRGGEGERCEQLFGRGEDGVGLFLVDGELVDQGEDFRDIWWAAERLTVCSGEQGWGTGSVTNRRGWRSGREVARLGLTWSVTTVLKGREVGVWDIKQ